MPHHGTGVPHAVPAAGGKQLEPCPGQVVMHQPLHDAADATKQQACLIGAAHMVERSNQVRLNKLDPITAHT